MSINLLAQNHNNVKILPKQDTVCFGTTASLWTAGNSFIPISYFWSNGETTPTISINSSGTYTLTVTGYLGQSNQQVIINKSKNFIVLDKPKINPLTPIWVCKFDTVKLEADAGYNNYLWMNGTTNQILITL